MNCIKPFSFLGQFSFYMQKFSRSGLSNYDQSEERYISPTYPLIDGKTRLYIYLISGLLSKTDYYVIYEQNLNAFCLHSKMADLSAYRDQQFRVIIFPLIFKFILLNKLLFQGLTIFILPSRFLGHSRRVRKKVGNEFDIVRGKFVVLHNGRTDLRVILASWGPKKDHHGTR